MMKKNMSNIKFLKSLIHRVGLKNLYVRQSTAENKEDVPLFERYEDAVNHTKLIKEKGEDGPWTAAICKINDDKWIIMYAVDDPGNYYNPPTSDVYELGKTINGIYKTTEYRTFDQAAVALINFIVNDRLKSARDLIYEMEIANIKN